MIGYIAGLALFLLSGCDSFLTQLSENNTTVANISVAKRMWKQRFTACTPSSVR